MDDFDRHFSRFTAIALVGVIGGWLVGLTVLGFIGWVIIKILQSQGIV